MARTPPGETRERVLAFVREALERGRSPSIREVQAGVGLRSPEGARQHLNQLVRGGQLEKADGARGWRLAGEQARGITAFVPLLGEVPAGHPAEAVEQHADVVPVTAKLRRGRRSQLFALRVRGDSMRDAAILPGDLVIVDSGASPRDRDIVVARVGGEATVKQLWMVGVRPELRPANPAFETIRPRAGEELVILGKVIEVRRYL